MAIANNRYNHVLGSGQKCALLVSDMQIAYTEGMFDADFRQDKEIDLIKQMVKTAHANSVPIIYTIIAFNDYEITHPNIWLQKIPQLAALKTGTKSTELDPRLPFNTNNDLLLVKKHTSAFYATPLANQLYSQGVDTIIVTGCTTSGCVRATVVDGMEHGFRMMVVKDAVADRWEDAHRQALFDISAKYGDVIDSNQGMSLLAIADND